MVKLTFDYFSVFRLCIKERQFRKMHSWFQTHSITWKQKRVKKVQILYDAKIRVFFLKFLFGIENKLDSQKWSSDNNWMTKFDQTHVLWTLIQLKYSVTLHQKISGHVFWKKKMKKNVRCVDIQLNFWEIWFLILRLIFKLLKTFCISFMCRPWFGEIMVTRKIFFGAHKNIIMFACIQHSINCINWWNKKWRSIFRLRRSWQASQR